MSRIIIALALVAAAVAQTPCTVASQFTGAEYQVGAPTADFLGFMEDYVGLQIRVDENITNPTPNWFTFWNFGMGANANMAFYQNASGCMSMSQTWNFPQPAIVGTFLYYVTVADTKCSVWQMMGGNMTLVVTNDGMCTPVYEVSGMGLDTSIFYNFVPTINQAGFMPCTPTSHFDRVPNEIHEKVQRSLSMKSIRRH